MKKVYYKGQPYEFKMTRLDAGQRHYSLYRNGLLTHSVMEEDLDKRTLVSIVLDAYYKSVSEPQQPFIQLFK
jgi:hypothetical protein